jgi:hypothetical protein
MLVTLVQPIFATVPGFNRGSPAGLRLTDHGEAKGLVTDCPSVAVLVVN